MSSRSKQLNIIITNSFQNDFIEPLEDLIRAQEGDSLKLDYEACQEKWIEYFGSQGRTVDDATINQFITWLKSNTTSSTIEGPLSYHEILEKFKHRVHLNYNETKRIWGNGSLSQFINDLMNKAKQANENELSDIEYQLIHLRDWHDQTDTTQRGELDNFGIHCLKGTHGSKFASPLNELIEKNKEFNIVLNSNNISSFDETNLESILETLLKNTGNSKRSVNIGIFGVVTNVKIQIITFELKVIQKFKNVYVCGDFCGGFNNEGHIAGINLMKNIFRANVVDQNEFKSIFGI